MSEAVREALAQLQAAREGQRRTEQYEVEQPAQIVKEVTEEEYQAIVKERQADFVVGKDSLGYKDDGKEIWESEEALKERAEKERQRKQEEAERAAEQQRRAEEQQRKAAEEKQRAAQESKAKMFQAFQAGARASPAGSPPEETAASMDVSTTESPKRKLPGAVESPSKKATPGVQVKCEIEESQVVEPVVRDLSGIEDLEAAPVKAEAGSPPPMVAVKKELNGSSPTVVKKDAKIKVEVKKAAVKKELLESGANLQEWIQGGSCAGVKVEQSEGQDNGQAGLTLPREEDGALWFYFVDAFELERASPPRVYLFGKVLAAAPDGSRSYQSCCLVVGSIERSVHLLLNPSDIDDEAAVQEAAAKANGEFDDFCRGNCPGVRKLRAKLKWRNYAFEKHLPQGGGYLPFLKVTCDATGQMPLGLAGGESFTHVFGANTSLLERLMLSRRITGPSWLRLVPGSFREDAAKQSFCALELHVTPKSIYVAKSDDERRRLPELGMPSSTPPLRVLSVSMQTHQQSAQQPHEAVVIACSLHPAVTPEATDSDRELKDGMTTWTALRRLDARPMPPDCQTERGLQGVQQCGSEVTLLTSFLSLVQQFDPDVICGYNAYSFDLDVLAARMQQLNLSGWQKLGRLRRPRERQPRMDVRQGAGFWVGGNLTAGRLVCDVLLQARDLLPKLGSYDLPFVAASQINERNLQTVEPERLPSCFDSGKSLGELANLTLHSALCIVKLAHSLQILPLTRQLTNLAGNLWNSSLQNKRAERNEMLLCHEFHRKKFVLPDKESMAMKKRRAQIDAGGAFGNGMDNPDGDDQEPGAQAPSGRRGKAAYSGGLVLEPKVGLYDDFVMLLDFNSLYPSIIQEHNICFTTVDRPDESEVPKCGTEAELLAKTHLADGTTDEGVLPQVLRRLVESRREVKSALKSERNPQRAQTLEIRQKALKLTANSMYGCLGFQNSRFYAKPLAALITAKGREALQTTITVVQQELQLDVVYGDTDSVFVNTKTADHGAALQAAQQIKRSVNKRYKRLEIEIDAVFVRLMLLKKKKYAAIKVVDWAKQTFEHEFKGLDIVRRDWCGLAKEIGEQVLMKVLEEGKEDSVHWVHEFLSERAKEMDEKRVPLERYVITKGLTKAPKDYPDIKNQPHVQVALRLMERGKAVRPGQEIPYVICELAAGESGKASLAERARHPYEFSLDPSLRVDVEWYKKQQVHPLVTRLLSPVESTDPARIAECLGMDAARFAQAAAAQAAAANGESGEPDMEYVYGAAADVNALFDRKVRWKDYRSLLPGVTCSKCQHAIAFKQLLQPESWQAEGIKSLYRCDNCAAQVHPKRVQNLMVMQLKKLFREHMEGWVRCPDENIIEKTRRVNGGQNMITERMLLRELEYNLFLTESEEVYVGADKSGYRGAAKGMGMTTKWLLDCNGYNWVDCKQLFGSIFGHAATEPAKPEMAPIADKAR